MVEVAMKKLQRAHFDTVVASLSSTMSALQCDLQDKANECEVLLHTKSRLSKALEASDFLYEKKALECERLQKKLQMVTSYVELRHGHGEEQRSYACKEKIDVIDQSEKDETKEQEVTFPLTHSILHHQGKMIGLGVPKKTTMERNAKKKQSPSKKKQIGSPSKRRDPRTDNRTCLTLLVCVDDAVSEDDDSSRDDDSDYGGGLPLDSTSSGPRQAHFFSVLRERDDAKESVNALRRELLHAHQQLLDVKAKLRRSNALRELAYEKDTSTEEVCKKHDSLIVC